MSKINAMLMTLLLGSAVSVNANAAPRTEVVVDRYYHPMNEPNGLYVVDFVYAGGGVGTDFYLPLTYRVYCPTKTVRDITDGIMGTSRTSVQEDKVQFGNDTVLRRVVNKICR